MLRVECYMDGITDHQLVIRHSFAWSRWALRYYMSCANFITNFITLYSRLKYLSQCVKGPAHIEDLLQRGEVVECLHVIKAVMLQFHDGTLANLLVAL